jgi:nicotinate phosphoribosyltransferase
VASGDLNEYKISEMLRKGAPVDSFGVGTEMVTSKDAPALGGIYKLVEQEKEGRLIPKMKFSEDKATYPAKKQVYRTYDNDGKFKKDIIGLPDEAFDAKALLLPVIKKGKVVYKTPTIQEVQKAAKRDVSLLPDRFKRLDCKASYPVTVSRRLSRIRYKTKGSINVSHGKFA